jgi:Fe-S cluster biosynthesis and repair protein YggX
MAERMVQCSKLKRELPALDETTPAGDQALKMVFLLGGAELRQRVRDHVSAAAWELWKDHMRMVINEYRLDPTTDESNAILREHLVDFLFGVAREVPNYAPPEKQ